MRQVGRRGKKLIHQIDGRDFGNVHGLASCQLEQQIEWPLEPGQLQLNGTLSEELIVVHPIAHRPISIAPCTRDPWGPSTGRQAQHIGQQRTMQPGSKRIVRSRVSVVHP
jgi:hypothetical protein